MSVPRVVAIAAFSCAIAACASPLARAPTPEVPAAIPSPQAAPPSPEAPACGHGARLRVHFYDVGQALSALVDLPDGRHVLVDTGESPTRSKCRDDCALKNRALLEKLRRDLDGAAIDLVWITHQHSDHIGGAPDVFANFKVNAYADNGTEPRKAEVRAAHHAAETRGTAIHVVDPEHATSPIANAAGVVFTPLVPSAWPPACAADPNACSILLRLDFCGSSILFTGDAQRDEEALLAPKLAPVTLLQVGHHGSETSTTPAFLARARPRYAVISAAREGEGLNADYCHPRATIVERVTKSLGGPGKTPLHAFGATHCAGSSPADWIEAPASDRLWSTSRDGDVVLSTTGDGVFLRE